MSLLFGFTKNSFILKIYFFEIPGGGAPHQWNQYFERNQTRPSCGLLWKRRERQSSLSIYGIDERGKFEKEQYLMPLQLMNDYNNPLSVLKSWWVLIEMKGVTEIKIHLSLAIAQDTADNAFSRRLPILDSEHWLFLILYLFNLPWITSLLL